MDKGCDRGYRECVSGWVGGWVGGLVAAVVEAGIRLSALPG